MAEARRRQFALRKASEAIVSFDQGHWSAGLPKAKAAVELLLCGKGGAGSQDESTLNSLPGLPSVVEDLALLCGGACLALAACGHIVEALEFFARHAKEIADEGIRDHLLTIWVHEANTPARGDLVQVSESGGAQLVGLVLGTVGLAHVRVRITSTAAEAAPTEGPRELPAPAGPEAQQAVGEEILVDMSGITLLTLRLSEEQRCSWRALREEQPALFGERMSTSNEARWQRLFGAAARAGAPGSVAGAGAGACGAAEDLGLPLEQTFAATLYGLITEHLQPDGATTDMFIDVLGCRPALELENHEQALQGLLAALPGLALLSVRFCGPEVGSDAGSRSISLASGQTLVFEVRCGLYHEVYPDASRVDLVVAMNAGVGAAQYAALWGPTFDLLQRLPGNPVFAITSYTSSEIVEEARLLRNRWAETYALIDAPELAETLRDLIANGHVCPWTLPRTVRARGASSGAETLLCRGDVVLPPSSQSSGLSYGGGQAAAPPVELPTSVRVFRGADLLYVGPNQFPGRSRNFGKLVFRVGAGNA